MSRRQSVTWAATSVPELRRQWCNALDQIVDRFSEGLAPPEPGTAGAGNRRLERTQAKLATEIEIMKAENNALRGAELFWVARDMVDVSMCRFSKRVADGSASNCDLGGFSLKWRTHFSHLDGGS